MRVGDDTDKRQNIAGSQVTVLVVDDFPLVRSVVSHWLKQAGVFDVVETCGSAEEALGLISRNPPDVLVADIKLPDSDGLNLAEAARRIRPSLRILILTAADDACYARKAAKLGIEGYIRKTASLSRLVDAVRSVASCATVYELAAVIPRGAEVDILTEREIEVLELVAIGCHNSEIAERLFVSLKTVEYHVANLLAKLGARSRVQAVVTAQTRGILRR